MDDFHHLWMDFPLRPWILHQTNAVKPVGVTGVLRLSRAQ